MSSSHQVAKALEFQLQHHSLQRNPKGDLLENGLVGSPCSPRDSQESRLQVSKSESVDRAWVPDTIVETQSVHLTFSEGLHEC